MEASARLDRSRSQEFCASLGRRRPLGQVGQRQRPRGDTPPAMTEAELPAGPVAAPLPTLLAMPDWSNDQWIRS